MRAHAAAGLASLAIVSLSSAAQAQEAPSEGEPPPAPAPAPAPPPEVQPITASQAVSLIELLPASAFPEPQIRGIQDGSLSMTFHGLQWPYYPRTGIGVSGYAWVDSGYETIKRGNE